MVETKIEIDDEEAPTATEEMLLQNNDIALSAIHDALDERTFEQIKNIKRAHEAWKKLEESFEGTQAVKGAKAYILKEKFASFKMLAFKIWHIGHYSSEEWFGHHDTKSSVGRYNDR